MSTLGRKSFVIHAAMLLFVMASGCQLAPGTGIAPLQSATAHGFPSQQLIIKFKQAAVPCTSAGIADFASAAKVRLELVRPMSGDACVVRQTASTESELDAGRARMKRHPATEWVEADAPMRPR